MTCSALTEGRPSAPARRPGSPHGAPPPAAGRAAGPSPTGVPPVRLADVGAGQREPAEQRAGSQRARVAVARRASGPGDPAVEDAVRVAEALRERPGEVADQFPAAGGLPAQLLVRKSRQIPVVQTVRADLHARGGDPPDLVVGEQRLARAERIPRVEAARPARQDEDRRPEAVLAQHRQRLVEEVRVPVVEGQPDQPAPPRVFRGQQLGHPHPGQPPAAQPGQLLVEAPGRDGDAVRIVARVRHRVIREDPRLTAGVRAEPGRGSVGATSRGISGHQGTSVG